MNKEKLLNFFDVSIKENPLFLGELIIEFKEEKYYISPINIEPNPKEITFDLSNLRRKVLFNQDGDYRPLKYYINLARDWYLKLDNIKQVYESLNIIYPLSLLHVYLENREGLRIEDIKDTLSRQTGRYSKAREIKEDYIQEVSKTLCSNCIRNPRFISQEKEGMPCPEACSVFISLYCERVKIGDKRLKSSHIDHTIGFAEFSKKGNLLREKLKKSIKNY